MSQWRPIETAPKDGTRILVFTAHGEVEIGEYVILAHDHFEEYEPGIYRKTVRETAFWNNNFATHWMALPEPPQ